MIFVLLTGGGKKAWALFVQKKKKWGTETQRGFKARPLDWARCAFRKHFPYGAGGAKLVFCLRRVGQIFVNAKTTAK